MQIELENLQEVNRLPHVWFAWFPVYAEENERDYGQQHSKVYFVWLQKVNRKKIFINYTKWYYTYWICKE